MEIDQPVVNSNSKSIASATVSTSDEPFLLSFPKKRPLHQDDPFFQEGNIEYKTAWLRLEDENAYLPDMVEANDSETHSRQTPPQTCHYDRCHGEYTFSSAAAYEYHYETNHRHICQECKKAFPGEKWLELHLNETHNVLAEIRRKRGEKTYQCFVDGCDRLCFSADKRRLHLIDKHHYPKSFNFKIVQTGIISVAERMKQIQREKALWKSREEGRQKVNQEHPHGVHSSHKQNQKQHGKDYREVDDSGTMDIESTTPTNKHRDKYPKKEQDTAKARSAANLPPKKNVFKQYRSREMNFPQSRSPVLETAMETDTVPVSSLQTAATASNDSGVPKGGIDMEIDQLQQSMARLMIPRSVANKMYKK